MGKYTLGIFATVICVYPVLLWGTDLIWRFVDVKSVVFAGWVYGLIEVGK